MHHKRWSFHCCAFYERIEGLDDVDVMNFYEQMEDNDNL